MDLVIHPSTSTQSYVFGSNPHVKPLQAVRLRIYSPSLFPLVQLGNMVKISCQGLQPQRELLKLAVWKQLISDGCLGKKKQPRRKTVQIEFLCFLLIPVLSRPHPHPPHTPTPQQGQHDLCTRSRDPWKLQKAARGNIWTPLMGEWRSGSEAGMTGAWWKCWKATHMWQICSASVMTGGGAQRGQVSIPDPTVSPRMAAPQLRLCRKARLRPLIQSPTSDWCLQNHLFDCFISFLTIPRGL